MRLLIFWLPAMQIWKAWLVMMAYRVKTRLA